MPFSTFPSRFRANHNFRPLLHVEYIGPCGMFRHVTCHSHRPHSHSPAAPLHSGPCLSRTRWSNINSQQLTFTHLRYLSYVQGQTHEKRREYFYFIDHHGQLFLDDARIKNFTSCFKDKEFLLFFFQRLKLNDTGNYEDEFPYLSPCGRERNYVRCDDVPVVYTHFLDVEGSVEQLQAAEPQQLRLSWGGAGDKLTTVFEPWRVCMLPSTGRVYHPIFTSSSSPSSSSPSTKSIKPSKDLPPVGLIKSSLAIELSKYFEFERGEEEPPTHLLWCGERYELTNELIEMAEKYSKEEE